MRRRHTWLAVLAAGLALTAAACSESPEPRFLGEKRLNVGFKNDQPGTGQAPGYRISGFDYLVAQRATDKLGVGLAKLYVPSGERASSLTDSKETDLIVATYSITNERMDQIDFVGPYAVNYQGILVGEKGSDITSLDKLDGRTVCTYDDTTSAVVLDKAAYKRIKVVSKPTASDCIEAMTTGPEANRPDAMSTDQLILYGFADRYSDKNLRVVPDVTFGPPQRYGIGLRKHHREDCLRLREIIKDYVTSADWLKDLEASLPQIRKHGDNWKTAFQPSPTLIDANSCASDSGS